MRYVTAALAAVVVLSGCSGGGTAPVIVGEAKRGGTATVAEVNAFSSFNPYSADGNTDINSKIGYITTPGSTTWTTRRRWSAMTSSAGSRRCPTSPSR
ncbi:family 5 extracellular solute-binding protein [Arthrobacter nitrophenolicus]|uniref:Family 5 extracellular solute-binding protein n=2 Tax=Arthrobacter nitrophenolicus TaxID=683150 RepID=L8TU60_9MICC|nr:family 5 extracellular solute-binding protein [Arthrobacter nitrophenolicus]